MTIATINQIVQGNGSATLYITPPSPATSTTIFEQTNLFSSIEYPIESTLYTIQGLENGTTYNIFIYVTVSNPYDPLDFYETNTVAVTPGYPSAPTGVTATPGNASATVTWTPPTNDGGLPITGYTVSDTSGSYTFNVSGPYSSTVVTGLTNGTSYQFVVAATNSAGTGPNSDPGNIVIPTNTPPEPIVCFMKGTNILTEKGYVLVENLKVGTVLLTNGKIIQNNKLGKLQNNQFVYINSKLNFSKQPIQWVSSFTVDKPDKRSYPICFTPGSIDKNNNMPSLDLYVSPEHSIYVNKQMIPAKLLVNGKTIFQDTSFKNRSIEYYHIEMPYHCAIISNGVLTESYLDSGNRGIFKDAPRLRKKHQHL